VTITEANDAVADVHDRMAVMLEQAKGQTWLNGDGVDEFQALYGPYPAEESRITANSTAETERMKRNIKIARTPEQVQIPKIQIRDSEIGLCGHLDRTKYFEPGPHTLPIFREATPPGLVTTAPNPLSDSS